MKEEQDGSTGKHGFRPPMLVDRQAAIVVGHVRWSAARNLGIEQVPVTVAADRLPSPNS
jgi:ParB-like chromosome segregation protein Spo0J